MRYQFEFGGRPYTSLAKDLSSTRYDSRTRSLAASWAGEKKIELGLGDKVSSELEDGRNISCIRSNYRFLGPIHIYCIQQYKKLIYSVIGLQ